ncbi:MAG: LysE family translocator [Anaerolineae bacterium]|nr:LysE family translocator [Anaerolineae bacterium]
MVSTEFLITSLVVVLVPGAGVIYTVSTGLAHQWRASIVAVFGCTVGIVPHLIASILGLSAILQMSEGAFQVLKVVGTCYLLFLAWSMWRDTGPLKLDVATKKMNAGKIALKGILINSLNPKLTLFFFAYLPLFIAPGTESATQQMIRLSVIFMLMTLVIFSLYGILSSAISKYLISSPKIMRWTQQCFALIFAGLAVKLALSKL